MGISIFYIGMSHCLLYCSFCTISTDVSNVRFNLNCYLLQDPLHDQIKNEQLRELAVLNGTFQPDYLGGSSSRG